MARAAAQVADGSGGKLHIAASLGRLLKLVGLPRDAVICRGPRTAAVLQAYEGGGRESFWGSRRAQERSGVNLPDLPGPRLWFARGPVMGEREPMPSSGWRRWSLRSLAASCAPAPGAGGRPSAGPQPVRGQLAEPLWAAGGGRLRRAGGAWRSRSVALAEPGHALALEALHARATGPRPDRRGPWPVRRRWRSRARLGYRTGTRRLIFWPESWRELAGGSWSHRDLRLGTVAVPGFDGDWARLSDEIVRRSRRALVRSGLGGLAQPSGGPARAARRRRFGCRPARG
jgi:hypothetical protein